MASASEVDATFYRAMLAASCQHSQSPAATAVAGSSRATLAHVFLAPLERQQLHRLCEIDINPLPKASLTLNTRRRHVSDLPGAAVEVVVVQCCNALQTPAPAATLVHWTFGAIGGATATWPSAAVCAPKGAHQHVRAPERSALHDDEAAAAAHLADIRSREHRCLRIVRASLLLKSSPFLYRV
jgi:hypothetical protein